MEKLPGLFRKFYDAKYFEKSMSMRDFHETC